MRFGHYLLVWQFEIYHSITRILYGSELRYAPQHNLRLCKVAIEGCRPYVPETPLSRATFMELMNNHNLPLIHQNLPNKESFY